MGTWHGNVVSCRLLSTDHCFPPVLFHKTHIYTSIQQPIVNLTLWEGGMAVGENWNGNVLSYPLSDSDCSTVCPVTYNICSLSSLLSTPVLSHAPYLCIYIGVYIYIYTCICS